VVDYVAKMKGMLRVMSDADTIKWLDQELVTSASTPPIDMKYFSAYEPSFGFMFCVERVHNLSQKLPHIVITSIVPPGSLYASPPRAGNDVHIFVDYDPQSTIHSMQFVEEMLEYNGLPASEKLGFVIDVKAVRVNQKNQMEIVDVGWTFFPILELLENEDRTFSLYANSGLYAVRSTPLMLLASSVGRASLERPTILRNKAPEPLSHVEKRQISETP